jgi:CubicO group peptidase (beta-lactamase class C family)
MADVQGTCDERFSALREQLSANLDSGADLGASVAVTLDGELVVDLWGGFADEARTQPWTSDTIVNVWSTTKTMTALAAMVLVSRGEIDVHAPVASYWPEFKANGKEAIEVRHLLSHTSGLSGWDQPVVLEDLYDWEKSTSMLAAQAPWWEPGTASGYHALSHGHLIGEVIRRVTGQSLGEFFATEVAGPLGGDFHIGLSPADDHRVSPIVPPPPTDMDMSAIDPDGPAMKTFTGPAFPAPVANSEGWRRAQIGAANGHGNARSVATIQAVLANGGEVGGVRLLTPEACAAVLEPQSDGIDLVIGIPVRFGLGYGLPHPVTFPNLPAGGRACTWGGYGGSTIVVDQDHRMTVSYVMNRMEAGIIGDDRGQGLVRATYAALAQR